MPKVALMLKGGTRTQGQVRLTFHSFVLTPWAPPSPCEEETWLVSVLKKRVWTWQGVTSEWL